MRAKITNNAFGAFIAESGVIFPYGGRQLEAYPGAGSISHASLSNLTTGDPHTQYLPLTGGRTMNNNLGLSSHWINSSGNSQITNSNNRGLKFAYAGTNLENIHVGNKSTVVFDVDNSKMSTAKGVAKAWLHFDASGVNHIPEIKSYYNIHQLEKLSVGKYKVVFTSGTLGDNNYIAFGSSNARSTASSREDFDINKVGIVLREGNDTSSLRSLTFCVLNDAGEYVDAQINELVVYGIGVGEGSGVIPTVVA